ncbi:hypothetical protein ACFL2M_01490 [Patescibacteria group bacterium]
MNIWKTQLMRSGRAVLVGILLTIVILLPIFFLLHAFNFYTITGLSTGDFFLGLTAVTGAAFILYASIKAPSTDYKFGVQEIVLGLICLFSLLTLVYGNDLNISFNVFTFLLILALSFSSITASIFLHIVRSELQQHKSTKQIINRIRQELRHFHIGYRIIIALLGFTLLMNIYIDKLKPQHLLILGLIGGAIYLNRKDPLHIRFKEILQAKTEVKGKKYNKSIIIILVVFIVVVGSFLRIYDLDQQNFHADEFNQIAAFEGYIQTGDFVQWDFINQAPQKSYNRSVLYTQAASLPIKYLGLNEFSSRIVGAIVSSIALLVLFFMVRGFTNRHTALWATALYAFYPVAIYYARYARNYSVILPFYLITVFAGYKTLTSFFELIDSLSNNKKRNKKTIINFILWSLLLIAAFLISYQLVPLSINFIPAFLIAALVFTCKFLKKADKKTKTQILSVAGVFLFVFGSFLILNYFNVLEIINIKNTLSQHVSLNIINNPHNYLSLFLKSMNFPRIAAIIFLSGIIILAVKPSNKNLYLLIVGLVPLVLAVYFWNRYIAIRYIFMFTPIFFIFSAVALKNLTTLLTRTAARTPIKPLFFIVGLITIITFAIPLSIPGFSLEPFLQKAQADWEGDDAARVIKRGVDAEYKKAFKYINAHWKEGDAIVTGLGSFTPIYLQPSSSTSYPTVYKSFRNSNIVYRINDPNVCSEDTIPVASFIDLEEAHERIWVVDKNMHLWHDAVVKYLLKNATNISKQIGIKKYVYNAYYENKQLFWPSIFLLDTKTGTSKTPEQIIRCEVD